MKFIAKLQQMASSEIINIIPKDVLEDIKQKDPHPLFQAYVVGHEGEAIGEEVGVGLRVLNWFSSAINKIWKKLNYGTKIFPTSAAEALNLMPRCNIFSWMSAV